MRKSSIPFRVVFFLAALIYFVYGFLSPVMAQRANERVKVLRQEADKIFNNIDVFDVNEFTGIPRSVRGKLGSNIDLNQDNQIVGFLKNSGKVFLVNQNTDGFKVKKKFSDDLYLKHAKVQQTFKGIPVWGSELIVHSDKSNTVIEVNGRFTPNIALDVIPLISSSNAMQIALSDLGPAEYRWKNPEQEKILKEVYKDDNLSWEPKPELVIAPKNGDFDKGEYRLAWKMQVAADGAKLGNYEYFIDAKTGEIINKFNSMAEVTGSGISNYNGTVQFSTTLVSPNYYQLYDSERHLKTYTAKGQNTNPGTLLTDSDNYWDQNKSAVDAHWGAMKVYDFYKNVFNRNSFNDAGAEIISTTQYLFVYGYDEYGIPITSPNNAKWDGAQMLYGAGDGLEFSSVTSLGICGHEITHAVTTSTANLTYEGESGALNEAFSDIFGTAIEFYSTSSKANWLIGEECYTPGTSGDALRYMNNPNLGNQPDTYAGTKWASTVNMGLENDYGHVHANSGVLNYAFYLMCMGGTGVNDFSIPFTVTGITIEKARAIAYKALTTYLISSSNYADARNAFLSAAVDLYGSSSQEYKTVSDAFGAVGIGIKFTAENSFGAGTIKINGFTASSGSIFFATEGSSQTLEAISQDYPNPQNNINNHYVWNTTGSSLSNWKLRPPNDPTNYNILNAISKNFTFIASSADKNSAYIADLKKSYYVTLVDNTEFDGNITADIISIIEQNSGSVSVPLQLTLSGSGRTYNFAGWENGFNGTVTPTSDMTIEALYKMPQKSNIRSAFSNSSQRKFIRTPEGYYHLVYESMGKIWYERSTNGGVSWVIENNGKPLNTDYVYDKMSGQTTGTGSYTTAKHPSLDYCDSKIFVAFQEQSGSNYRIRISTLENGTKIGRLANDIPFTTYGLYSEDVYPEIAIKDDRHAAVAIIRNDAYGRGLEVHYLLLYTTEGFSVEKTSGCIEGTDQNTGIFALATDRNSTDKFHIAWEQAGSIQYAKLNFTYSPCDLYSMNYSPAAAASEDPLLLPPPEGEWNMYQLETVNVSNAAGVTAGFQPSMIAAVDGTARVAFKGYEEYEPGAGDGWYTILLVNPDNTSWIPYLNKYGGEVFSPQISLGSDTYFVGWTELYDYSYYRTICTDASTLSVLEAVQNSSGRDIQINSGGTRLQQFSMGFNSENSSLPYSFRQSDAIGTIVANKTLPISKGRGVYLTKDSRQLYFIMGNVNAQGMNINFAGVKDTVRLEDNLKKVNSYLTTEPFSLKANSTLSFAVRYGARDSAVAKNSMKKGEFASFKLDLIDDASGRVIGTYIDENLDKDNIFRFRESVLKLKSEGLEGRLLRLRLVVSENMKSHYC